MTVSRPEPIRGCTSTADGGVARLPVFDVPELYVTADGQDIDLATLLNGSNPGPSDANHSDYARLQATGRGIEWAMTGRPCGAAHPVMNG